MAEESWIVRLRQRGRFRTAPCFALALAAVAGILIGDRLPWSAWPWLCVFGLLALGLWFFRRAWLPTSLRVVPLTVVAFTASHLLHVHSYEVFPHREQVAEQGVRVLVHGVVLDAPHQTPRGRAQFTLKVREVTIGKLRYKCAHRLIVRLTGASPDYGDVMRLSGLLSLPEAPRNPGQFNYRQYIKRQDMVGLLEVSEGDDVELIERRAHAWKSKALQARAWMAHAITRDLDDAPEITGILTAMTLGMRKNSTEAMEEPFRFSGTLHIFAVSGLHVGIFALIVWLMLKPFRLSRTTVTLIIIPFLFFYAYVTGWRPSAVRAATMATIFLGGFCLNREPRLLNSLGLAALVILSWNTNQLFLPGFQLSFLVLISIILGTKALQRPFRFWLYPDPFLPPSLLADHEQQAYGMRRWFGDIVGVSGAAWLGSLPLMVFSFNLITPVAVLANCFLMPVGFCILLTAAMSMLSLLIPYMGWANILFNNANFAAIHLLVGLAEWFSGLPGAHFFASGRVPFTNAPVEVRVLDMPLGGAAQHIHVRGHSHHLIDTGHSLNYHYLTQPYLRYCGINDLDQVFLTHGDTSHLSATPILLERLQPKVYQSTWLSSSPSLRRVDSILERRSEAMQTLAAGTLIPINETAHWEVLFPPDDHTFSMGEADNRCLILRLHVNGWKVLFMADAGFATEKALLSTPTISLASDILIKGNHASDVSGLSEFLAAVNPRAMVIDGETGNNAASVRRWTEKHDCRLFDQWTCGAVLIAIHRDRLNVSGFLSDQLTLTKRER